MKVTFEVEEEGFDDNVDETKEKDLVAQFLQFIQVRCMTFQGLYISSQQKVQIVLGALFIFRSYCLWHCMCLFSERG